MNHERTRLIALGLVRPQPRPPAPRRRRWPVAAAAGVLAAAVAAWLCAGSNEPIERSPAEFKRHLVETAPSAATMTYRTENVVMPVVKVPAPVELDPSQVVPGWRQDELDCATANLGR